MHRTSHLGVALGLSLSLLVVSPTEAGASRAQVARSTVTTTADTVDVAPGDGRCADSEGSCSLRAAIQEANARPGDDEIVLQNTTYPLTLSGGGEDAAATGDLDVSSTITIEGVGASLDLAGLGDRGFDVTSGASLTVRRLTVKNGQAPDTESGGAFRSSAILRLDRVSSIANTVQGTGASGGAVANLGGTLVIDQSLLAYNSATRAGGAIESNGGTTTINGSDLALNSAGAAPGNGGAFHLTGAGTVTVTGSTVSYNAAGAEGGGLWNSSTGRMSIQSTRINDNQANGAEATNGGGGVFNDGGTLSVVLSTVIRNTAPVGSGSGGAILNDGGSLSIGYGTLVRNSAARAGGGIETNLGSVYLFSVDLSENGTGAAPGNGGGMHVTGAGQVRVLNSVVRSNSAAAEGGGLWNSAEGVMSVERTGISGNSANGVASDAGGGGLYNDGGSLTLVLATVSGNAARNGSGSGGGILNNAGSLSVGFSTIADNDAARAGGGIETNAGSVSVVLTDLTSNETGNAPGNGGAIHVTGAAATAVRSSRIVANTAANEGGGLWNSAAGTMLVDSTILDRNAANGDQADAGGGAIYNETNEAGTSGGTLTITRSTIIRNSATTGSGSGGAILNARGVVDITDTVIFANSSARAGGGIETVGGTGTTLVGRTRLVRVNLRGNATGNTPGNGGGLHLGGAGTVSIDRSEVEGNTAANEGGGLWNSPTGQLTVTNTTVRNNSAGVDGRNVYQEEPVNGGRFTVNGRLIPTGPNTLTF